ncbi:atrial natriuretic peptide receptor 3-like [Babylonia areolata]|uniref:atrial natriuretic peptide receptor 3-like n=1 Tax=Babylonia areolata TaxID=304850 RepID=UPI003FCFDCBF
MTLAASVLLLGPGPGAHGIHVNVAVLLPYDDFYLFSKHRVEPALELTIKKLNDDTRLLRGHHVSVRYSDSKCDIAVAMDRAFKFYMNEEVHVFFGPVCDFAVAPVARQIRFWNVPMISTGAMAMDFIKSRKVHYPLLTRLGPAHFGHLCHFFSAQSRHFRWQKIKMLYTRDGQDYLVTQFCHLVVVALHYTLKDMRPDLEQDYFKMSEDQTEEEIDNLLADEVGLDYGDYGEAFPRELVLGVTGDVLAKTSHIFG